MASPFEILEAFVKVGERGLTAVMRQLQTLQDRLTAITRPNYTLRFFTGTTARATASVQNLATALQNIQAISNLQLNLRIGGLQALTQQMRELARAAASARRSLAAIQQLSRFFSGTNSLNFNIGGGRGGGLQSQLNQLRQQATLIRQFQQLSLGSALGVPLFLSGFITGIQQVLQGLGQIRTAQTLLAQSRLPSNAANAASLAAASTAAFRLGVVGLTAALGFAVIAAETFATSIGAVRELQQVRLGAVLGSAAAARNIQADLQSFASVTGASLEGLLQTSQKLAAFGFNVGEIAKLTRSLGVAALATGSDLDRFVFALAQIREAGFLTGEELRQLRNSGIPIVQELASHLGVSVGEIAKLTEARTISADEVVAAFEKMTAAGSDFARAAEQQATTVIGSWNRLTEQIKAVGERTGATGIVADLLDSFNNILDELAWELTGTSPMMEKFYSDLLAIEHAEELASMATATLSRQFRELTVTETQSLTKLLESVQTPVDKAIETLRLANNEFQRLSGRPGGPSAADEELVRSRLTQKIIDAQKQEAENDPILKALKKRREELEKFKDRQTGILSGFFPSENFKKQLADIFEAFPEDTPLFARAIEGLQDKLKEAILDAQKLRQTLQPSEALLRGTEKGFNASLEIALQSKQQDELQKRSIRAEELSNTLLNNLTVEVQKLQRPSQIQQIPGIFLPAAEIAGL